jgi:hypothetical protein
MLGDGLRLQGFVLGGTDAEQNWDAYQSWRTIWMANVYDGVLLCCERRAY